MIWKIVGGFFASLVEKLMIYLLGRSHERAAQRKKMEKQSARAHEIEDRLSSLSDDDISDRLRRRRENQ